MRKKVAAYIKPVHHTCQEDIIYRKLNLLLSKTKAIFAKLYRYTL